MKKNLILFLVAFILVISGCSLTPSDSDENNTSPQNQNTNEDQQDEDEGDDGIEDENEDNDEQNDVIIGDGGERVGEIEVENGNVTLGDDVDILGPIRVEEGDVVIGDDAEINGKIEVKKGNITIADGGDFNGSITALDGDITIGNENDINGKMQCPNGIIRIGDENQIKGDVIAEEFRKGEDNTILGTYTATGEETTEDEDEDEDENENEDENEDGEDDSGENMVFMEGGKKVDMTCRKYFDDMIQKYGKEYNDCYGEVAFHECETKARNIVLVLDVSGSMANRVGGETMMEVAKDSVNLFLSSLTGNTKIALVLYGHKGGNTTADKAVSCEAVETVSALSSPDPSSIMGQVSPLSPVGWTPIASALEEAKAVLSGASGDAENIVILVSDGEETCGGNPTSVASELASSGIQVNTIGFNVGGGAEKQLRSIATNGGGVYFPARTAQELNVALISQVAKCIEEDMIAWGKSVEEAALKITTCADRLARETATFEDYLMNEVPLECKGDVGGLMGDRQSSIGSQIADASTRLSNAVTKHAEMMAGDIEDLVEVSIPDIPDIPDIDIPDINIKEGLQK